ncbi:MAG: pyridoxal-phosphate dependent enzyme, partial [Actinomycetota bacterium]|nr:pyridoxal-phosphate dependent enzyme [Actinomycetota bacterium]
MVTLEDIELAQRRLAGVATRTPLVPCPRSGMPGRRPGRLLYFKPESFQPVGSFKLRGAYNRISSLSEEEKNRGVV